MLSPLPSVSGAEQAESPDHRRFRWTIIPEPRNHFSLHSLQYSLPQDVKWDGQRHWTNATRLPRIEGHGRLRLQLCDLRSSQFVEIVASHFDKHGRGPL
jgi:hypothetical protein